MSKFIPVAEPVLDGNEKKYINKCIDTNWISSQGEFVEKFEKDFSDYCNVSYGVSTSNGTVALHLALEALDIGEGDEVIIPDLTFAATINTVIYTGATPVLVDIDEDSWTIDVDEIRKNINKNTKAIIPVHLYGQPCAMDEILRVAEENNIYIIEDCAEAHGAEFNGKKVGSFGDISCFSFYGNKIITTGEGGICLTDDKDLYKRMKKLRDHGMSPKKRYWHDEIGYNYRMTNMQAAIGVAQLEKIDDIMSKRKWISEFYDKELKDLSGVTLQKNLIDRNKVCWMYSVLINEESKVSRDEIIKILDESKIGNRPFFYPMHEMDIYKEYAENDRFEKSTKISQRGLNLPTSLNLTEEDLKRVIYAIKSEV